MATLSIGPGIVRLANIGATRLIANESWYNTTTLNGINRIAPNGLGYQTNKPQSSVKPFTQFEKTADGALPIVYELNLKTAITIDTAFFAVVGGTTAPATQLAAPVSSPPTVISATSLGIAGSSVANAVSYKLFTSATSGGTYTQIGGTLSTPSYTHTGLTAATTYYYKWQAIGNGTTYLDSAQSAAFSGTTAAQAVPPTITSFTPPTGAAGTTVTVTGTNLSGATAATMGGIAATRGANTATSLVLTVPAGGTGVIAITTAGGTATSTATFTVTTVQPTTPTITSLTPDTAPTGSTVTLTGTNLTGTTAVAVNGVAVSVFNVVNATTLTFTVPGNATTGAVSLTTAAGSATGPVFTVGMHDPIVASITPASGVVGTRVTIGGGYFLSATTVTFSGGVVAPIESLYGDGQIKVLVPDGATTGPITLSNGGASVPTDPFTVQVYNPPFVYYPTDSTADRQADYFPAEAWGDATNGVYQGGSAKYLNAGLDGYAEMYFVASGYAIDLPTLTAAQYTEMQVDNGPRIPLGIPAGPETLYAEVYRSPYLGTSLKRLRIYGVAAANILAILDRVRFLTIDPDAEETYLTPGYAQTGYVA